MDDRDLDNWKLEYDITMFKLDLLVGLLVGAGIFYLWWR